MCSLCYKHTHTETHAHPASYFDIACMCVECVCVMKAFTKEPRVCNLVLNSLLVPSLKVRQGKNWGSSSEFSAISYFLFTFSVLPLILSISYPTAFILGYLFSWVSLAASAIAPAVYIVSDPVSATATFFKLPAQTVTKNPKLDVRWQKVFRKANVAKVGRLP